MAEDDIYAKNDWTVTLLIIKLSKNIGEKTAAILECVTESLYTHPH